MGLHKLIKRFRTQRPYENQNQGLKTLKAVEKARADVAKKYPRPAGGSGFIGTTQVD